jgi:hypothetical protein
MGGVWWPQACLVKTEHVTCPCLTTPRMRRRRIVRHRSGRRRRPSAAFSCRSTTTPPRSTPRTPGPHFSVVLRPPPHWRVRDSIHRRRRRSRPGCARSRSSWGAGAAQDGGLPLLRQSGDPEQKELVAEVVEMQAQGR